MENRIIHQTTIAKTLQQNERVERKHRHILNVARGLFCKGNLPKRFWGKYVLTTSYLINRTPSSLLKGKIPYELLHGKLLSYSHLQSFGCLAYIHDHDLPKDKFRARGRVCIFLGYPFNKKGWQFYGLENKKSILKGCGV